MYKKPHLCQFINEADMCDRVPLLGQHFLKVLNLRMQQTSY